MLNPFEVHEEKLREVMLLKISDMENNLYDVIAEHTNQWKANLSDTRCAVSHDIVVKKDVDEAIYNNISFFQYVLKECKYSSSLENTGENEITITIRHESIKESEE